VLGSRAVAGARAALRDRALKEPEVAHHLELMEQGIYFNGVERYLPHFYKQAGVLTDYLASETLVVVAEPRSLFDDATRRAEELVADARQRRRLGRGPRAAARPASTSADGSASPCSRCSRAGGVIDAELVARSPDVAGGEDRFVAGVRALLAASSTQSRSRSPSAACRHRVADRLVEAGVPVADLVW
jgi:transcription-repair coupling factor (superfamily II helicase)